MFEEPPAVSYIRKYWSTQGIEVTAHDDRTITATLGVEVEDLSAFIEDLNVEFGLEADYRYNAESKLGTLVLTHAYNHFDELPGGPKASQSHTLSMFFACTTAALSVLSGILVCSESNRLFFNGTF